MSNFRQEMSGLLNKYNREIGSNTPDFILASFLVDCLKAMDEGIARREVWFGRQLSEDHSVDDNSTPSEIQEKS